MKLIDRYIVHTVLGAILVLAILVLGIDFCVTFMGEQGDVGKGQFNLFQAFVFVLLILPSHFADAFPVIALVGAVMGLSMLNHHSEMVVIRTQGYSLLKISALVLITAFGLSVCVLGIQEWIAPQAKQRAEIQKALLRSGGQAIESRYGFWLRAAGDFVHIDKILYNGELLGITRYTVLDDELKALRYAQRARYESGEWKAQGVWLTRFEAGAPVSNAVLHEERWSPFLKPEFLSVVSVNPEDLSLSGLKSYIRYRKKNGLYAEQYELALYQKVLQPLTVLVMVFLAIPFVFGAHRSAHRSVSLVLSTLIGLSYFLLNKISGAMVQFYELPVILGAVGPGFFFMVLGFFLMYHRERRLF